MKKRMAYLILPVITLVLEILPYGAVLNFMRPSEDGTSIGYFTEYYSYFSLMPFGYANFAPLITAAISCVVLAVLGIYCITGKARLAAVAKYILWVGTAISFGPLLFGIRFFSFVGLMISLTLIAESLLLHFTVKSPDTEQNG